MNNRIQRVFQKKFGIDMTAFMAGKIGDVLASNEDDTWWLYGHISASSARSSIDEGTPVPEDMEIAVEHAYAHWTLERCEPRLHECLATDPMALPVTRAVSYDRE